MIEQFTDLWDAHSKDLRHFYCENGHPNSYEQLFQDLVTLVLSKGDFLDKPIPETIVTKYDGSYSGALPSGLLLQSVG